MPDFTRRGRRQLGALDDYAHTSLWLGTGLVLTIIHYFFLKWRSCCFAYICFVLQLTWGSYANRHILLIGGRLPSIFFCLSFFIVNESLSFLQRVVEILLGRFAFFGVRKLLARLTGSCAKIIVYVVAFIVRTRLGIQGETSAIDVSEFAHRSDLLGETQDVCGSFGDFGLQALPNALFIKKVRDFGCRLWKSHAKFPIALVQMYVADSTRFRTHFHHKGGINGEGSLLTLPKSGAHTFGCPIVACCKRILAHWRFLWSAQATRFPTVAFHEHRSLGTVMPC